MSAFARFKQSEAMDVISNNIYMREHDPINQPMGKGGTNTTIITIPKPAPREDGYCYVELNTLFPTLDGFYDFGISAVDDQGNESPELLTAGFVNIGLDFVAPNPPTDGSIHYE